MSTRPIRSSRRTPLGHPLALRHQLRPAILHDVHACIGLLVPVLAVRPVAHHRREAGRTVRNTASPGAHRRRLRERPLPILLWSFITFEHDRGKIVKKLAGYHQFHAVRVAVERTVAASGKGGETSRRRSWHTPGLGQEPDDGVLRQAGARSADGEPHHRRAHPSHDLDRSALRHLRAVTRSPAARAGASAGSGSTCGRS